MSVEESWGRDNKNGERQGCTDGYDYGYGAYLGVGQDGVYVVVGHVARNVGSLRLIVVALFGGRSEQAVRYL